MDSCALGWFGPHESTVGGTLSRKHGRKSFVFWHQLQCPVVPCSEVIHLDDKRRNRRSGIPGCPRSRLR
jgi:hypothetical protein